MHGFVESNEGRSEAWSGQGGRRGGSGEWGPGNTEATNKGSSARTLNQTSAKLAAPLYCDHSPSPLPLLLLLTGLGDRCQHLEDIHYSVSGTQGRKGLWQGTGSPCQFHSRRAARLDFAQRPPLRLTLSCYATPLPPPLSTTPPNPSPDPLYLPQLSSSIPRSPHPLSTTPAPTRLPVRSRFSYYVSAR